METRCAVSWQFSLGLLMEEQMMGWDSEAAVVTELVRMYVQSSGSQIQALFFRCRTIYCRIWG